MSYTLLYYIKDNFSSLFVRKCVIYNQKTWKFVRNIVPLQAKSKTNDMKRIKMPLLARIILAILLGVIFGNFFNEAVVRAFLTFNGIFSQFLGFMIPLIIIGLVTPAIADIGHGAGKLLLATVGIAFADTILAGLLAYGTGSTLFPHMIANSAHVAVDKVEELKPFFEIKIPAMVDVMSALVFSFIAGLGIAHKGCRTMQKIFQEFKEIVSGVIAKVIIPLLPLYIFGIFLGMTFSGEAYHILLVFAQIILVILVLHIVILLYEYLLAGGLSHKNPFKLLLNMLPAYFTALGTSSSAATIPVTLKQTLKNGVTDGIAGFTIPLCATIHLSGSMMKITCCALTICLINGLPCNLPLFLNFIFVLAILYGGSSGSSGRSRDGSARSARLRIGFQCRYASTHDSPLYCNGQFRHRLQCNRRWRYCCCRG